MEYLVTMTTHVPDGTPAVTVADIRGREAARSSELAAEGHLLRLWRPPLRPGEWRTLGLFASEDRGQLEDVLASMPLRVWRTDEITDLWPHPNDPPTHTAAGASPVSTHQPDQAVFRPTLPEDIDWEPFPSFPPPAKSTVLCAIVSVSSDRLSLPSPS